MLTTLDNPALSRPKSSAVQDERSSDSSLEELLAFERMLADLSARFANLPAERDDMPCVNFRRVLSLRSA
jgi:hypothetical protein